ncbi:MAG: hypothetical protein IKA05_06850 [Clostridia bacterium]|nr:hypothetical protein [Clostridia bacterium]
MKLYGYKKEHYDYVKDGQHKVGDSVTLYFGYRIPTNEGQGICALSYGADFRLSQSILAGKKPIVIGADYDLIPGQYGNLSDIVMRDVATAPDGGGGKEKK